MSRHNPRVDEGVREAVATIIERDLSDPRVAFVTVTDVRVTPDRKHATVYYTTVDRDLIARDPRRTGGDDVAEPEEAQAALEGAAPRIQALLAQRMRIRNTPQLRFEPDPVAERASKVDQLLRELREDRP